MVVDLSNPHASLEMGLFNERLAVASSRHCRAESETALQTEEECLKQIIQTSFAVN